MPKMIGIDKSKAKKVTHSDCGAIIEYFEIEVSYDSDGDKYIVCPNCNRKMFVR